MNPQQPQKQPIVRKNQKPVIPAPQPTPTQVPQIKPSAKAGAIANPPQVPVLPEPTPATIPQSAYARARAMANQTQEIVKAQTAESQKRDELLSTLGTLGNQPSLTDVQDKTYKRYGVKLEEDFNELRNINLQLASMNEASELTKTKIAGGAGQTYNQGIREVTQEDRENAVRTAGLSARAAVLQSNMELARTFANDAVEIAYKQRGLDRQNLVDQLNEYGKIADSQTAQLVQQAKEEAELEIKLDDEMKANISDAMINGATQSEMAALTRELPPGATAQQIAADREQKNQMAKAITARGATQMRNLDMAQKSASIRASNASANAANTRALVDRAEAGDPNAIAALGIKLPDNTVPSPNEIAFAQQYAATGQIPSGMKESKVSFGKIAALAKELPKAEGQIVNTNTGIKPDVPAGTIDGYAALRDAIKKADELAKLNEERTRGVSGGIAYLAGSSAQKRYVDLRSEITDLLARARTGAAITEFEQNEYAKKLPGVMAEPLGRAVNANSTERIQQNFAQTLANTLHTKLSAQGLTMYGFTPVNLGGETYVVGEVLTNGEGQKGIVQPDGSITLVN